MSSTRYWHEEKFSERKVSEMTSYAFVLDADNKQLAPTKEQKAWFLIRKKRAILISKYPMVIQLKKKIPDEEICKNEIRCGIDDGGLYVGVALVQKCQTRNKVVFKGTIEQRNDVKHLMDTSVDIDVIIVIIKDIDRRDFIIENHLSEKEELRQAFYRNVKQQ